MRRRYAFTLIELLVVVAIIGILISILVPALARARAGAKLVKCQAHLRAIGHGVQFYLGEYNDAFPYAGFYGCLGYVGRNNYQAILGTQVPESQRPMNSYFGVEDNSIDEEGDYQVERKRNDVFGCPADRGDPYPYLNLPGTYFVEHGTSYTYASDHELVPPSDIQSCRELRLAQVRYTAKKIVFHEPTFSPQFNIADPRAQWHHPTRTHANLLFADGHVNFLLTQVFEWSEGADENNPYY